jgi:hypothetical protein
MLARPIYNRKMTPVERRAHRAEDFGYTIFNTLIRDYIPTSSDIEDIVQTL